MEERRKDAEDPKLKKIKRLHKLYKMYGLLISLPHVSNMVLMSMKPKWTFGPKIKFEI